MTACLGHYSSILLKYRGDNCTNNQTGTITCGHHPHLDLWTVQQFHYVSLVSLFISSKDCLNPSVSLPSPSIPQISATSYFLEETEIVTETPSASCCLLPWRRFPIFYQSHYSMLSGFLRDCRIKNSSHPSNPPSLYSTSLSPLFLLHHHKHVDLTHLKYWPHRATDWISSLYSPSCPLFLNLLWPGFCLHYSTETALVSHQ